jgi:hypothetical protein
MRTKSAIGLLGIAAVLAWTGMAGAQTVPPIPKVQLPSGETVWDLSGDWEALIENYGPSAGDGTYPNVYRITQTGNTFSAIRLKDTPPTDCWTSWESKFAGRDRTKRVQARGDCYWQWQGIAKQGSNQ